MAESKKIVIVGIPGVGKSSLLSKVAEMIQQNGKSVRVINFGTVMFEEAKALGVQNRDQLRRLAFSEQQSLQMTAGQKIAAMSEDIVIIDTHAFIMANSSFYPGLPRPVLDIVKPTFFISVSAQPEEIFARRQKDTSRQRDIISIKMVKREMAIQESMVSTCSVLTGSPIKPVLNRDGKIEEAAKSVIEAIET